MDADETLRLLRLTIKQMRVDEHPDVRKAHADEIAEYFEALDSHLSGGGRPPEAWAEGPDAPWLDDQALTTCPLGIPHTIQPIAPGVYGTPPTLMAGPDGPLDPEGSE